MGRSHSFHLQSLLLVFRNRARVSLNLLDLGGANVFVDAPKVASNRLTQLIRLRMTVEESEVSTASTIRHRTADTCSSPGLTLIGALIGQANVNVNVREW